MLELYRTHLSINHNYVIYPYSFAGNNWKYDCRELQLEKLELKKNELYAIKYDVDFKDINIEKPKNFLI